ncbi:MAG: hypothetical protein LBD45_04440, partial [Bacteroidales bacterium]|nr:hypothetical protein [Bacteroidales bacterium]
MKRNIFFSLALLITTVMNAQSQAFPYEQKWKQIEQAARNGEYKSLLPEVNAIIKQATIDGNKPETVKSLLFQAQILAQTKDDESDNAFKIVIENVEKGIPQFQGTTAAVLQSLLANIYHQYMQHTQWKRRNITELDVLPANIAEWSSRQLLHKAAELYNSSLGTEEISNLLKKEKTENWKQILTSSEDINLYPTLYDVLTKRHINFLQSASYGVKSDALWQENQQQALQLLDELINFHKNDADKSAYLNFQLQRITHSKTIEYDTDNETSGTGNPTAEQILKLAQEYVNEPFAAWLYFSAAQYYQNSDRKRAFEICQQVTTDPKNKWSVNATSLTAQLQQSELSLTIDEISLPDAPVAVTVTATNIDKVYYRISEVSQHISRFGTLDGTPGKIIQTGSWDLQHFDDFSPHGTIAKLNGLPQGAYRLEVANTQDFAEQKINTGNMLSSLDFIVCDWSIVQLNNGYFQLLNRKTGKPVANKALVANKKQAEIALKTDERGIARHNNANFLYCPESKAYISLSEYLFDYDNENPQKIERKQLDLFLDRAIYRPGQTVYFKGILYSKNGRQAEIVKNAAITIELQDNNAQKISELVLTTNEYGSVFGEFILPKSGLTGWYSLHNENGSAGFLLEEYKRPTFEVKMDTLKGEFTLEQRITTTGKAESFAGVPLSETKAVYRVERQEISIYPIYKMIYPPYPSNSETIEQGETQTDKAGKFEISFTAKPKNAKKAGEYRTYTYHVVVDVTDVNGETHTASQHVTVGDLPRMLSLEIPQKALLKDFTNITVKSVNLNGVREDSKGKIIITQLIEPERILLPNKATAYGYDYMSKNVDYQLYDKETFVKLFPHLPYSDDEMNPQAWKHGKVAEFDFDTQKSDSVSIKKLSKGFYLVEAFSLFGKDTIKTMKLIEIIDDKTLTSTSNNFFSASVDKENYRVGDNIEIRLLSDFKEATAMLNIESNGVWIEQREIPIVNGKAIYTTTVKPEYLRGGLYVSTYLLKNNGYKQQNFEIKIVDTSKDLKISMKTFRNKIQPGKPETWELTISGADRDKLAAEVLATMYDASLDQFASNRFAFNPLYYSPYGLLYQRILLQGFDTKSKWLSPHRKSYTYKSPQIINLQDFNIMMMTRGFMRKDMAARAVREEVTNEEVFAYAGEGHIDGAPSEASYSLNDNALYETIEFVQPTPKTQLGASSQNAPQIRKNLQETAFFYPNLYTDENGDVKLSFTSPEALTRWKLLILAHTQDLQSGAAELYTTTQKELMVVPNMPRFLREGDKVVISAKVNNLSGKDLSGQIVLKLYDALTDKNISNEIIPELQGKYPTIGGHYFDIKKDQHIAQEWEILIPQKYSAIKYEIVAEAGENNFSSTLFSDGEQGVLPVLPNRMLVTETMPIFAKEGQTKTFTLAKLVNGTNDKDATQENFNLSLEITTNPLWLAVMSLPYLREYPYECSEQIFSRLYGNILSTHILNSNPKIKQVFDNWNAAEQNVSELEQNAELKNILLEETPWIRQAQNETEQRQRLALLFDLNRMRQDFSATQQTLLQRQNSDGGFAWFDGGQSSAYITGHIVQGFGQLEKMLNYSKNEYFDANMNNLISKAIKYIDDEMVKEVTSLQKQDGKINGKTFIHYYYVRSFWKNDYPLPAEAKKYLADINKNISEYFDCDLQRKAMIATTLLRYDFQTSAKTLIHHLSETSVETDEMGMYWKDNRPGWLWYQSPVEAQTKAVEAFAEIAPEKTAEIEEMKIWLLKNRQTNAWNSTKATTDAVYALTTFGKDWTNAADGVAVRVGDYEFVSFDTDEKTRANRMN